MPAAKVAVRLLRMILRQISRGDDQIDVAALRWMGVQHRVIAAIRIDAEQRLVFAGKRWVSVICRILTAAPLATGSLNKLSNGVLCYFSLSNKPEPPSLHAPNSSAANQQETG